MLKAYLNYRYLAEQDVDVLQSNVQLLFMILLIIERFQGTCQREVSSMFQTEEEMKRRTPRGSLDRLAYLQQLVTEFQTTDSKGKQFILFSHACRLTFFAYISQSEVSLHIYLAVVIL